MTDHSDSTELLDRLVREVESEGVGELARADHRIERADGTLSKIKQCLGLCGGRQAVVEVRATVPLPDADAGGEQA